MTHDLDHPGAAPAARPSARRAVAGTALFGAAAIAAALLPTASAGAAPGEHDRAASTGTVAQVRQAIDAYRDVDAAVAAGYVPVSGCESSPEGGMGVHYLNPELVEIGDVRDPAKPQVLLYGPDRSGGLRLLGAEYWQPDVGQPAPRLAGERFDGPMPGHGGDMPVHYDLHVWTHVANPAGVFAPWNRAVRC
jgi:hypothetical protein